MAISTFTSLLVAMAAFGICASELHCKTGNDCKEENNYLIQVNNMDYCCHKGYDASFSYKLDRKEYYDGIIKMTTKRTTCLCTVSPKTDDVESECMSGRNCTEDKFHVYETTNSTRFCCPMGVDGSSRMIRNGENCRCIVSPNKEVEIESVDCKTNSNCKRGDKVLGVINNVKYCCSNGLSPSLTTKRFGTGTACTCSGTEESTNSALKTRPDLTFAVVSVMCAIRALRRL